MSISVQKITVYDKNVHRVMLPNILESNVASNRQLKEEVQAQTIKLAAMSG
jgi:hypothetical protein